jgi:hypothetical protein
MQQQSLVNTYTVQFHREVRKGNMWFLVVFNSNGALQSSKVNHSQLLNKFDWGNYYGDVVQFAQQVGIGGHVVINATCVIVRTR